MSQSPACSAWVQGALHRKFSQGITPRAATGAAADGCANSCGPPALCTRRSGKPPQLHPQTKGTLTAEEIFGLAALLNSHLIDAWFRSTNGNTQVSATELRAMPLPPLEAIHAIGREAMHSKSLAELDEMAERLTTSREREIA